jgi:hypothetical protein
MLSMISCVSADSYIIEIIPESSSDSFFLSRNCQDFKFSLTSSVAGTISPLECHGRYVRTQQSIYKKAQANDIKIMERESAKDGNYTSEESINLNAQTLFNSPQFDMVIPPAGDDVYTFYYIEKWPVVFTSNRNINYSGRGINQCYLASNDLGFVGSNLFHNHELSEDRNTIMWLENFNATILAADYKGILNAELQPNEYLGSQLSAHTTGISDLGYRVNNLQYDAERRTFPAFLYLAYLEGNDRYYGINDLTQRLEIRSNNLRNASGMSSEDSLSDYDRYLAYDWLPCCSYYYGDKIGHETISQGWGPVEFFDCSR